MIIYISLGVLATYIASLPAAVLYTIYKTRDVDLYDYLDLDIFKSLKSPLCDYCISSFKTSNEIDETFLKFIEDNFEKNYDELSNKVIDLITVRSSWTTKYNHVDHESVRQWKINHDNPAKKQLLKHEIIKFIDLYKEDGFKEIKENCKKAYLKSVICESLTVIPFMILCILLYPIKILYRILNWASKMFIKCFVFLGKIISKIVGLFFACLWGFRVLISKKPKQESENRYVQILKESSSYRKLPSKINVLIDNI